MIRQIIGNLLQRQRIVRRQFEERRVPPMSTLRRFETLEQRLETTTKTRRRRENSFDSHRLVVMARDGIPLFRQWNRCVTIDRALNSLIEFRDAIQFVAIAFDVIHRV